MENSKNNTEEKEVWYEVYTTIDDIDFDGDTSTETIESFDTEQEAIDFIENHIDKEILDYDKWTFVNGCNQRIE